MGSGTASSPPPPRAAPGTVGSTCTSLLSHDSKSSLTAETGPQSQSPHPIMLLQFSYSVSDSFVTPWAVAHQSPLSMGFPRQEYWSGFPFPSPRDLSDPGNEPTSPALAGEFFTAEPPGKLHPIISAANTLNEEEAPWFVRRSFAILLLFGVPPTSDSV